jgi:hypothetical protein
MRIRIVDFGTAKVISPDGLVTKDEIAEIARIR